MQREILKFSDQNSGFDYEVGSQPDSTFGIADNENDSLQQFFSRPIKTQAYAWGTGTNLFESFDPWTDFWQNDRVLNRIANYNLLRCKLCVKFVLNGNGFHYGRAIASYIPLHTVDGFTKDRAFFIEDVVEASQRPHIYLDPTNSQGGTMCLPFVWPHNALDVPDEEWGSMGKIIIHGMQNLKHANGASDSVTVSVFVWAEDVVMSTPTANEPGSLSPQGGEYTPQGDEYGDGIVSRPANMVAKYAGALSSAPVIGVYAKATQLGASAVANIARLFGYSRPNNLSEIQSYKPTYLGNMANANVPDTATKLTFDAKQELTCDTRTFGLDGTDEMDLKSIATRESFLTNFAWAVSDTSEDLLWNCEVNPVVWNHLEIEGVNEWHLPACCFATLPFRNWRGSMKYRFQIVASSFHKGRLKITYDPSYPLTNEYNTNFTRVIDLAEERDFTVEIGWGQQYPFLLHRPVLSNGGLPNTQEIFSSSPLGADPTVFANGIISVYVVNELTVPNSTADNDIEVNVFVSAGDDYEVANPGYADLKYLSWFQPQGGEYTPQAGDVSHPDSDNTALESAPMKLNADEEMAPTLSDADHTMDVFFGDPVSSIRQMLKRYNYSKALVSSSETGWKIVKYFINDFPLYRGFASDGVNSASAPVDPTDYNYCQTTWLNYFTPAFVCWRGGIRWKYHLTSNNMTGSPYFVIERNTDPEFSYSFGDLVLPDDSTSVSERTAFYSENMFSLQPGGHVTDGSFNPVIEAEIPFQRADRFALGKQSSLNLNIGYDSFYHKLIYKEFTGSTTNTCVHAYVATGEDFTMGFYTGPPVAYYQVDPTPSAL